MALVLAPVASSADGSVALALNVIFVANGTITVSLPDGTPVGVTSGTPTAIAAGYYTLQLSGPGACTPLPLFELKGPGVDLMTDMTAGEEDSVTQEVYLHPSSTYTWKNDGVPGVVHTFATTANVEGATPKATPSGAASSSSTVSSSDIVGSGIAPIRGTLVASVSAAGDFTIHYRGKPAKQLAHGRYTVRVNDRSSHAGLLLRKGKRTVRVSGVAFVGKRSLTVDLKTGVWSIAAGRGRTAMSFAVR